MTLHAFPKKQSAPSMKRLTDLVVSFAGLVVLLPLFLVIILMIWLDDGRPIFFRQERIGLGGLPFRMWKFRTMVKNADSMGPSITIGVDPRITRLGLHLRSLKIDELPQLINVLIGEMSLVGPRPEVPRYVALYTDHQREVLTLKPGITDLASIKYRNENDILGQVDDPEAYYRDVILPDKITINLAYACRATWLNDMIVIFKTVSGIS